jgi:energy-dependent translational throttle protein EttA
LLRIIAGVEKNFNGELVFAPVYSVGLLEQEPQLDETKRVIEVVKEGTQEVVDVLNACEEVNHRFGLPEVYENPEEMDRLMAEQARLQEKIDQMDAWNLESRLERAMDALQCPPNDQLVSELSEGKRPCVCCPVQFFRG